VIKSFASRETAELFSGRASRRIPSDIRRRALQKLVTLHAAVTLEELSRIPGHRWKD
jgi:proteic killer suppression protein